MIYDLIIIGAGAAGLFAGASLPHPVNGLIIEKKTSAGRKLLMTGSGQCNLTHGGSIKDFISHYGKNGSQIRSILYRFNNLSVVDFFQRNGVSLLEREDQKIFPKSLQAQDILKVLVDQCMQNGLKFCYSTPVNHISFEVSKNSPPNGISPNPLTIYTVYSGDQIYQTKKLIIATGGCSYPSTGSDGSLFPILDRMGIDITPLVPALTPVLPRQYPYQELAGISFQSALVSIHSEAKNKAAENRDALLLTHTGFSGPAILNISRLICPGNTISINYYPFLPEEKMIKDLSALLVGSSKLFLTVLYEYFKAASPDSEAELPKRFLELACIRSGIAVSMKASQVSHSLLKNIIRLITHDQFEVQRLGDFKTAMVTAGGIRLTEINTKTMESKKYPNLFFAGEVLDVDGDTGGYNLQFAFSSGYLSAQNIV